ncbi:ORF6N domain-containing protein, partial [Desulfosarcina sp.]|uniref:ORF6N domain-containing protein n=1 Tax=Desulfosarcina sp. TaxID=2027861 RepID=UPI00397091BF
MATRVLNQAVSRNLERFPGDFMFELSRDEITRISQFVISSNIKYSKRVRAFTEHGALMAASLLNSPHAIQTSLFVV